MNEFTCLICLGNLFILAHAYIIELSEVGGQLQSAGTWLLTSKSDNFPIGNYPTQKSVIIYEYMAGHGRIKVRWLHPMTLGDA